MKIHKKIKMKMIQNWYLELLYNVNIYIIQKFCCLCISKIYLLHSRKFQRTLVYNVKNEFEKFENTRTIYKRIFLYPRLCFPLKIIKQSSTYFYKICMCKTYEKGSLIVLMLIWHDTYLTCHSLKYNSSLKYYNWWFDYTATCTLYIHVYFI